MTDANEVLKYKKKSSFIIITDKIQNRKYSEMFRNFLDYFFLACLIVGIFNTDRVFG